MPSISLKFTSHLVSVVILSKLIGEPLIRREWMAVSMAKRLIYSRKSKAPSNITLPGAFLHSLMKDKIYRMRMTSE